ncbi:HU family DNA-binding protein, partial [Pseudomonas aeruginosa]
MRKPELAAAIAEKADLTKEQANRVLNALLDEMYALHRPHLQLTSPYPGCWAPYFPVEFRHDASRRQSAEGLSLP